MMLSPNFLQQNLIGFHTRYAEEAWEVPNIAPVFFTVTEMGDEEVMVNLQLENLPELTADQQGHFTNVTPQQLWDTMEWLL